MLKITTSQTSSIRTFQVSRSSSRALMQALRERISDQRISDDRCILEFAASHLHLLHKHVPKICDLVESFDRDPSVESLVLNGLPASVGSQDLTVSQIISGMLSMTIKPNWGPYQFHQEKGGRLWSVLQPKESLASKQSGQSRVRFEHHTDYSWLGANWLRPELIKPRVIILAGVYNPSRTPTTYTSIRSVVERKLTKRDVEVLCRPIFRIQIPDEMRIPIPQVGPVPVLWKDEHGRWCIQVRAETQPTDQRDNLAHRSLQSLKRALDSMEQQMCVRHGSYALVSNLHGTHSRSDIKKGYERLLLRLYVGDLARLRQSSNVFDATQYLRSA